MELNLETKCFTSYVQYHTYPTVHHVCQLSWQHAVYIQERKCVGCPKEYYM